MSYNNLEGKLFEDLSGTVVSVKNVDGNIAHLDSGQRIAIERLLDHSFYNEYIDPNTFANKESNFYTFLGNQIKGIDVNSVGTKDVGVQINSSIPVVESHASAQASLRGEFTPSHDDFDEIERKKREMAENAANIGRRIENSNNKLKSLLGEDDSDVMEIPVNRNLDGVVMEGNKTPIQPSEPRETSVTMYDENMSLENKVTQTQVSQPIVSQEDPIYKMFSQVKRSTNFSLNVKLIEKIPRKDFMKMWEDSYEVSIIDYLVDEFTNKLLNDPTMIRDQLREALKVHVYGKPVVKKTDTKTVTKTKATPKKATPKKETPKR